MATSDEAQAGQARGQDQHVLRAEPVPIESLDVVEEAITHLAELYPGAVIEGKVDFDRLRSMLGDVVNEKPERHFFTWAGKSDAVRLLQTPSRATLHLDVAASVNPDDSQHVFIEGENLEVLKLLHRSYFNSVKMIYIDVPYNTGNDFIYRDNYVDPLDSYLQFTGQKDEAGNLLTSSVETSGRFHSSWLSLIYPRLFLAKQLLSDDGVLFVSIDDNEVHNLRKVLDEVFGEENFVGQIVVQLNPRGRHLDRFIAKTHEYVLAYARDASQQAMYQLEKDEQMLKDYNKKDEGGRYRELELRNRNPAFNRKTRPKLFYAIYANPDTGEVSLESSSTFSVEIFPKNQEGKDSCWTWGKAKFESDRGLLLARQTTDGGWRVFRKDYLFDEEGQAATTIPKALWLDKELNNDYGKKALKDLFGENVFDFPKSPALIEKLLRIGSRPDSIVMDFFAGSGTTAESVLRLNHQDGGSRRFILVELPEPLTQPVKVAGTPEMTTTSAICEERIRRVLKQLSAEIEQTLGADIAVEDLGVKVFRLRESTFKRWTGVPEQDSAAYAAQMEMFVSTLVDDWKAEDVIWEVILKEGFGLGAVRRPVADLPNDVRQVIDPDSGSHFYICLEDEIHPEIASHLSLAPDDLFVCRDSALTDELAANLALQCHLKVI